MMVWALASPTHSSAMSAAHCDIEDWNTMVYVRPSRKARNNEVNFNSRSSTANERERPSSFQMKLLWECSSQVKQLANSSTVRTAENDHHPRGNEIKLRKQQPKEPNREGVQVFLKESE